MEKVTGQATVIVGIHKSVAITHLSETWSDGSKSELVFNEIQQFGTSEFVEDCLNLDLNIPNQYQVKFEVSVHGVVEVEETDYNVTDTIVTDQVAA